MLYHVYALLQSREPRASIYTPGCGWAAETKKKVLEVFQTLSARALMLQAIRPCAEKAVWFTRLVRTWFKKQSGDETMTALGKQSKLMRGALVLYIIINIYGHTSYPLRLRSWRHTILRINFRAITKHVKNHKNLTIPRHRPKTITSKLAIIYGL